VFSTFRDPVDRLLSSFHYGIQFGGGMTIILCIVYYVHDKPLNCVIDTLYMLFLIYHRSARSSS
jgi:hypothetical protein